MAFATNEISERTSGHGGIVLALSLSVAALTLMVADWIVHPVGEGAGLAFAQVVLAVVCLVIGVLVVRRAGRPYDDDQVVIDLRDQPTAAPAPGPDIRPPRQVPDARASRVFQT